TFYGNGQNRAVLAADPKDSKNLLAVDADSNTVKYSSDGGQNWFTDVPLSQLVVQGGRFAFKILDDNTLISTIGWDPYNSCHILVGARQGGIYRSDDGGWHWMHVEDSEQIPEISAFYFPPTGPVVVGSFGRGLWKIDVNRGKLGCQPRV